jgi:hypothetical protein
LQNLWNFFEIYGYLCSKPGDYFIVSLTGTNFVNHAPELDPQQQPEQQQQQQKHIPEHQDESTELSTTTRNAAAAATRNAAAAAAATVDTELHPRQYPPPPPQQQQPLPGLKSANSGEADPWASPWEQCTVGMTLSHIKEGEEILEDYNDYSPPCRSRGDCVDFYYVS